MATPILSKPQQKKSLSAKKTPVKGLKNVLGQPIEIIWPRLQKDQNPALEGLLRKLLVVFKPIEHKIPWSKLFKMKKEERSAAKKAARTGCADDNCNASKLESMIFGINKVTRSLEKDEVCCVLLDANVEPKLLIQHIVQMAEYKSVPTLLIPFLKTVTLETIGFASAAVALKKQVQQAPENYFYSLFKKISKLSLESVNVKKPVRLFQDNLLKDEINPDETEKQETSELTSVIDFTDVYLFRTSKKERVFKPPTSKGRETEKIDLNFIPLSDDKHFVYNKKMPSRFFETPINNSKNDNPRNSDNEESNHSDNEVSNSSDDEVPNCSDNEVPQKKGVKRKLKRTSGQVNQCNVTYHPLKVKRMQGNECRSKATKLSKQKKLRKKNVS